MNNPVQNIPSRPDPVEVGSDVRRAVAHLREQLTHAFNRELVAFATPEDATLLLTPAAIKVLLTLTASPDMPHGAGLRITKAGNTAQDDPLRADMASGPAEDDRVIVEAGARVFVQPDAQPHLGGKVLTAQIDESGLASFMLRPQHATD